MSCYKETRVEVYDWEQECCGNTRLAAFFEVSQLHECFYKLIESRRTCFLFLLENSTTNKRKQLRGSYRGIRRDAWLADFILWNVNLENYSSWLVIWRFCVTREQPEFFADIRDFTALFYVILRRKSSKWLQTSIESDWYAICNMEP